MNIEIVLPQSYTQQGKTKINWIETLPIAIHMANQK